MKVKIISKYSPYDLEEAINDFIKEKDVIDAKYSALVATGSSLLKGGGICSSALFSALIMYKEPIVIKKKTFDYTSSEFEIDRFINSHNVVDITRVGETCEKADTVITYKERKDEN